MGIAELETMTKETISCNAAAEVIGCNPQLLRIQARECPQALGFPDTHLCLAHSSHLTREAYLAKDTGLRPQAPACIAGGHSNAYP